MKLTGNTYNSLRAKVTPTDAAPFSLLSTVPVSFQWAENSSPAPRLNSVAFYGRTFDPSRSKNWLLIRIVQSSGTQCWRGGGARATYLNWFHSASRKRSSDTPCTPPNSFEYKDAEGQPRTIKVPDVTSAEIIAEHYSNGNFTALAEYEIHT